MPTPPPAWLVVDDVRAWLRLPADDHTDDNLLSMCSAAVEPQVERARPDQWMTQGDPPVRSYVPDAEVYQAAVALAARVMRRRNSPSGIETMTDSITYVARYDPDISRALRQNAFRFPRVG